MPAKLAEADQMTIEEYLAFTDQRPDGERWELVEGVAVMSPSPTQWHQTICKNILFTLEYVKRTASASWSPMPGVGIRVLASPRSLPQPDVYVQEGTPANSPVSNDAVAIFEILSKSNTRADRAWRKRVYASVPNCQHYVTVATDRAQVIRHDRTGQWTEIALTGLLETLELPAIGASIPLRDIYRFTPIE